MHATGSLLYTVLERVRAFLDEPSLDAKYTNDFIVRHIITPEVANVKNLLSDIMGRPIIVRQNISLTDDGEYYALPPGIGRIYRLAKLDSDKNIVNEIPHRSEERPEDPGWWVEGRELHVRPFPSGSDATFDLWYTPSGNIVPHYSSAGGAMAANRLTLTLDKTPDIGDLDPREGAYIGSVLRAWVDQDPVDIEEQVVDLHAISNSDVTVQPRKAFGGAGPESNFRYEIVPYYMDQIWQAVAISSAINLGVSRNISEKQMAFLQQQLQTTLAATAKNLQPVSNENAARPNTSLLHNMVSRVRHKLPDKTQEKLSDDYLLRSAIVPEMKKIITKVNEDPETAIICEQTITTSASVEHYALNPHAQRIIRVAKKDASSDLPYEEVIARDDKDPAGHGWKMKGNRLSLVPSPTGAETVTVWYVASSIGSPHFAVDGNLFNYTTFKLSKEDLFSGILGTVDRTDHSYVGSTLRVTTSIGTIEERVITAHNPDLDTTYKGIVTVEEEFTGNTGAGMTYEIIPTWFAAFESAVVDSAIFSLTPKNEDLNEGVLMALVQNQKESVTALLGELRAKGNRNKITPRRNSMLHTIVEKVQTTLMKMAPELDYSADYLVRQGINNELGNVIARLNNTRANPYTSRFTLDTVIDQQYYPLPAGVGEITRIVKIDSSGRIERDLLPRGRFDPYGPNWSIEGNMISFLPYPKSVVNYEVWYIPNGTAWPHYAENGSLNADLTTFTLSDGKIWGRYMLGDVDKREGAYIGCVLRILGSSSAFGTEHGSEVIEERTISASDAETGTVTVERPFSSNIATGTCKYEIVPIYLHSVNEAVVAGTVANLAAASRTITERQQKVLYINYKSAMKTAGDTLGNMQGRVPKHIDKNTVDNPNYPSEF